MNDVIKVMNDLNRDLDLLDKLSEEFARLACDLPPSADSPFYFIDSATLRNYKDRAKNTRNSLGLKANEALVVADLKLDGVTNQPYNSHSGERSKDGTIKAPDEYNPPRERRFPVNLNTYGNNPNVSKGAMDAEVKLWEELANRYDVRNKPPLPADINPNIKGTLTMYVDFNKVCDSCQGVLPLFRQALPNLKVQIFDSKGKTY